MRQTTDVGPSKKTQMHTNTQTSFPKGEKISCYLQEYEVKIDSNEEVWSYSNTRRPPLGMKHSFK